MKPKIFFLIASFIFLFSSLIFYSYPEAQEEMHFIPDKTLCAKMIRFGIQAHERKRYLDAKEYFRKALHADSTSNMAWKYYDLAVIFALAEKVEKNQNLIKPDVSLTDKVETHPPLPHSQDSSTKPEAPSKDEFKIVGDDDGCY